MYRQQKIISSVVLAVTSFLSFLLFSKTICPHSISVSACLALVTLYCYNAQLLINATKTKRRILESALGIICFAVFFVFHILTFNFKFIGVALSIVAFSYLYLFGHRLFPLRKTVWLKLMVLTFVWTMSCAILPMTVYVNGYTIKLIFEAVIFVAMVLALSLPFEKRDAGVDAINNYTNIFNFYGAKKFGIVFLLILAMPVLISLCGWVTNILPTSFLYATFGCSCMAYFIYRSVIISKHNLWVIFDVLFLGWVCTLFLLQLV